MRFGVLAQYLLAGNVGVNDLIPAVYSAGDSDSATHLVPAMCGL